MPNRPYLGRMVDDAIAMFKPHVSGTEGAVLTTPTLPRQAWRSSRLAATLSTRLVPFPWCWA